jgi:hypothetical protein
VAAKKKPASDIFSILVRAEMSRKNQRGAAVIRIAEKQLTNLSGFVSPLKAHLIAVMNCEPEQSKKYDTAIFIASIRTNK